MKKAHLILLLAIIFSSNIQAQSGEWGWAMNVYMYNSSSDNASSGGRGTQLHIRKYYVGLENVGDLFYISELWHQKTGNWKEHYVPITIENISDRIYQFDVRHRFAVDNGGDKGWSEDYISFQTRYTKIGYKKQKICSNEWSGLDFSDCERTQNLFNNMGGYIDIYTFPKNIQIALESSGDSISAEHKPRIEAPDGYESGVYKWVYASKIDSVWRDPTTFPTRPGRWVYSYDWQPIANSSLNGSRFLEPTLQDIYGANFMDPGVVDFASNTYVALEYDIYSSSTVPKNIERSNVITLSNKLIAPKIASVTGGTTTCPGSSTGKIAITLERELLDNEIIEFVAYPAGGLENTKTDYVKTGAKTYEITGLSKGDYTLKVFSRVIFGDKHYSANSIDADHTRTGIKIEDPVPISYDVKDVNRKHISCYDGNDGSFEVTASGGKAPYKLFWKADAESGFNSTTELNVTGLKKGLYQYYIKDANDCELEDKDKGGTLWKEVLLTEPAKALDFSFATITEPSGNGLSNASVTLQGDGGTPDSNGNYQVIWKNKTTGQTLSASLVGNSNSGGIFTSVLQGIPAGTFTAEITDLNGCRWTGECIIGQPVELAVTITKTASILCFGNAEGALEAIASGGVLNSGDYNYEWYRLNEGNYESIGQFFQQAEYLTAGNYKVIVKDNAREKNNAEAVFNLTEPNQLTATVALQHIACYGENTGSIKIETQGGTGNRKLFYKRSEQDNYSEITTTDSNPSFLLENLYSGTYRFYITDENNCTALIEGQYTGQVTLSQPEKPISITLTGLVNPSGYGRTDGHIAVKVEGGTPKTTGNRYNIIWKDASGNIISHENSLQEDDFITGIKNLPEGTYTVEVTDANYTGLSGSCILQAVYDLTQPDPLIVTTEQLDFIHCYGDATASLEAHVQGGVANGSGIPYRYAWFRIDENGNELLLANETDSVLSLQPVGLYKVKIADFSIPENAVESEVITVSQPPLLVTEVQTRNISCHDGTDGFIRISVAGGTGQYRLYCKRDSDNDFTEYSVIETGLFFLDNLSGGAYTIYIQDANDCYAKVSGMEQSTLTLSQPAAPVSFAVTEQINPSGFGRPDGKITIEVKGGTPNPDGSYNIRWKDNSGNEYATTTSFAETGKFTASRGNLKDGTYSVEITDALYAGAYPDTNTACIVSGSCKLTEPDELLGYIEENRVISCNGMADGRLIAHVTGGIRNNESGELPYKYAWSKLQAGEYIELPYEKDSILSDLPSGNYRIVIEDYSRIVNRTTIDYLLVQPDLLQAVATKKEIRCGETTDVTAIVTGGTQPYTYKWSSGNSTKDVSNVGPGRYFVHITDARSCETTAVAEVLTPSDLNVTGTVKMPVCHQSADGNILVSVSGGKSPYTYRWNTGFVGNELKNLQAGIYTITVNDNAGCSFTDFFVLQDPEPVTVYLGEDRTLCNGQELTIAPVVEDPQTVFAWSGPGNFRSSGKQVTVKDAGTYSLLITDSKGCQATDEIDIRVKSLDISSEMVIASQVFAGDTIVIVNISEPEPERVEWLFESSDSLEVVEESLHFAKVIFHKPGYYSAGMRSHVDDCFMDNIKAVTVLDADRRDSDGFGQSIVEKFTISPNPNDGNFNVAIELNIASAIRLRIINIGMGKIVSDKSYLSGKEFNIPYQLVLPGGVHAVLLETTSGHTVMKMIVK